MKLTGNNLCDCEYKMLLAVYLVIQPVQHENKCTKLSIKALDLYVDNWPCLTLLTFKKFSGTEKTL